MPSPASVLEPLSSLQSSGLNVPLTVGECIVPVPHERHVLPSEVAEDLQRLCAGGKGWRTKEREGPSGALSRSGGAVAYSVRRYNVLLSYAQTILAVCEPVMNGMCEFRGR